MNVRKIVITSVALISALAGIFFGLGRSEYGNGYSEEQRKLWNEAWIHYPLSWRMSRLRSYDLKKIVPYDSSRLQIILDQKQAGIDELGEKQAVLRDDEKIPFELDENMRPDSSSLPAGQVALKECLERAQGGDAEACLVMALQMGWPGDVFENLVGCDPLSWRRVRDVNFWLSRADSLGHPGARFLKYFFAVMCKTDRGDTIQGNEIPMVHCADYTSFPGYEGFLKCLEEGDLLTYRVMRKIDGHYMPPGDNDRERSVLENALRRRIEEGDVRAMENQAALFFDNFHFDSIVNEMKRSFWHQGAMALPKSMQDVSRRFLIRMGMLDAEDTETVRGFRQAAEYARQAARRGSFAGMNYWLQFGVSSLDYFTREDWEEVFRYHRILLGQKYVPYFRGPIFPCSRKLVYPFYSQWDGGKILCCCYTKDTLWEVVRRLGIRQEEQDCLFEFIGSESEKNSSEEIRVRLNEQIALRGSDEVMDQIILRGMDRDASSEESAVYVAKIRELAAEGDPYVKMVLGFLYEQGCWLPRDLEKAWKCYGEVLEQVDSMAPVSVYYRDLNGAACFFRCSIQEAVRLYMLSMLVRNPDFPGRDAEKGWTLAGELDKHLIPGSENEAIIYLIARVYEDGIGTPLDKAKALEYYNRGQGNHAGCSEGRERLRKDWEQQETVE